MNVLIMDMGTRLNRLGGEARIANVLFEKLEPKFSTYYLGYETYYTTPSNNTIMLDRDSKVRGSARNNPLSEVGAVRALYYFFYIRNMAGLGISRKRLLERINWVKPDIIISNSVQDFPILLYLKRSGVKFKSVYIDHGSISTENTSGYFSKEGVPITIGTGINSLSLSGAKEKFFRFFDMNVALNLNQLKMISRFTKKVVHIPNGLDVKVRRDPRLEALLRKRHGIYSGDFVILYLGRLFDRQKNISTLIKAFKQVKGSNIKLLIVGDGPSLKDYKELAGTDERIIFGGPKPVSEINAVYNISNLLVLPSFWEGSALTVLEAAAHKLPILVSRDAYTPDLKEPHIPRMASFSTTNVDDLKRQIELIMKNETVRNKAIEASKALTKIFTEKRMIKSYTTLLNGLK